MEYTGNVESFMEVASRMINEGSDTDKVKSNLLSLGADEVMVETIIRQAKALRHLKRRKRGFLIGTIGSILLVVGFFLTVIFYHYGINFNFVMYSMTSVGVILLMIGLIEIIGW